MLSTCGLRRVHIIERDLIRERTLAGLEAAKTRPVEGVVPLP